MSDTTEISYWLREPGTEDASIDLLRTITSKVPEVGEIIHFNTKIDREMLQINFSDFGDISNRLRKEESEVKGQFVVVSVKRFIKIGHATAKSHSYFDSQGNTSSAIIYGPSEYSIECFEVIVEPFRHTELTETPIAKLRNKMSPIYGYMQVLKSIRDKDIAVEEMGDLLKELQNQAIDSIEDIVDFIRNKEIWK